MGLGLRLALAAALLGGCGSDDPSVDDFTIILQLDTVGDSATCLPGAGTPAPLTCNSYPLRCDSRIAIRLLDLPPEEPGAQPFVRDEKCLLLETSDDRETMCALGDPDFMRVASFDNVVPTRGQIEITIWKESEAVRTCPLVPYDLAGRPQPQADELNPAFGRRVIFDFGGLDPIAEVPLACVDTQAMNEANCALPTTIDMRADIDDITDLLSVAEAKAPDLQVRIGQPVPMAEDIDDFELEPVETFELGLVQATPPFWREDDVEIPATFDFAAGEDICTIVTDFFSQPAATCTTIDDDAITNEELSLRGYMVSTVDWDMIRMAIGINVFPNDGLILGRVVDTNMVPLDATVITADTPLPPVIQYINADLDDYRDELGVPLTATSSSGYFVAQGAKFRTAWDATRPNPTWRVVGTPAGGELNNRTLTVLVIQMTQDLKP